MKDTEDREVADGCTACCKETEVPTQEEVTALNAMRAIKDRVRELKRRISAIPVSEEEGQELFKLETEMALLKSEWKGWDGKRKEAARRRMILLGHEEGPL